MNSPLVESNKVNDLFTLLVQKGVHLNDRSHLHPDILTAITKQDPYKYLTQQCEAYKTLIGMHRECVLCNCYHPPLNREVIKQN